VDAVLAKLESVLGPREGEPEALTAGITNRNYRVRFGAADYVVRLCGADTELLGIDRDAECAASEAAAAAGIGPRVCAFLPEDDCLVTEFIPARPLDPEDVQADVGRVARALRQVHHCPAVPATFSAFRIADAYRELTLERGGALPDELDAARAAARRIEEALPPHKPVLCHNDLLPANLLEDDGRLWIIDWEYAAMGDAFFDLGNLSAMNGFDVHDDQELLAAYLGHADDERDLARLRLMRAAAQYREGMWGVVQQVLSDIDFDFAGYAEENLAAMLASDWEEWLDGAAA